MNVVFSLILLAAALGCIVFLLTRRENARRSQYGPSGLSEFRTDLPLDTLYTLRLDPGRQTIATLIFIREAFGYKEPLFPQEMLDKFMQQKLEAHRTK